MDGTIWSHLSSSHGSIALQPQMGSRWITVRTIRYKIMYQTRPSCWKSAPKGPDESWQHPSGLVECIKYQ